MLVQLAFNSVGLSNQYLQCLHGHIIIFYYDKVTWMEAFEYLKQVSNNFDMLNFIIMLILALV